MVAEMKRVDEMVKTAAELRAQAMEARTRRLDAEREEQELKEAAQRAEREERQAKARQEQEGHFEKCFVEIGQPLAGLNRAQHDAVYAVAWEHGHASGFGDVENYYGDFAELARKVLEAQR